MAAISVILRRRFTVNLTSLSSLIFLNSTLLTSQRLSLVHFPIGHPFAFFCFNLASGNVARRYRFDSSARIFLETCSSNQSIGPVPTYCAMLPHLQQNSNNSSSSYVLSSFGSPWKRQLVGHQSLYCAALKYLLFPSILIESFHP